MARKPRTDRQRGTLRTTGPFLEAEDESQEWPDRHAAIGKACKAMTVDAELPGSDPDANSMDSV